MFCPHRQLQQNSSRCQIIIFVFSMDAKEGYASGLTLPYFPLPHSPLPHLPLSPLILTLSLFSSSLHPHPPLSLLSLIPLSPLLKACEMEGAGTIALGALKWLWALNPSFPSRDSPDPIDVKAAVGKQTLSLCDIFYYCIELIIVAPLPPLLTLSPPPLPLFSSPLPSPSPSPHPSLLSPHFLLITQTVHPKTPSPSTRSCPPPPW